MISDIFSQINGINGPLNNLFLPVEISRNAPPQPQFAVPPSMPDLSGIMGQRDNLRRQAFAPNDIQMRPPVGMKELPIMGGLAILAHLLGAREDDISGAAQGFLGARQQRSQFDYESAMRADELRRKGLLDESNLLGEQVDKAERAKSENDEFLRQIELLNKKQKFESEEGEKDRKARLAEIEGKKKSPWENLHDDYLRRIGGMPEGPEKAEAAGLFRQFVNNTLPKEGLERLDALTLGKNTLAETGKDLDNQKKAILLPWVDKNAEQDFAYKGAMLLGKEFDNKVKEFNWDHIEEVHRWKMFLMQMNATNTASQIQNRQFREFFDLHKEGVKAATAGVKQWDTYIKDLEKRQSDELKSLDGKGLGVLEKIQAQQQILQKYAKEMIRANEKKTAALGTMPDPFDPESVPQFDGNEFAPMNPFSGPITPNGSKNLTPLPRIDPSKGGPADRKKTTQKTTNGKTDKKATTKPGDQLKGRGATIKG